MLVITRREGESFFVADDIEIVILESGAQVRVGIKAPPDVAIVRTELLPEPIELD